MRVCHFAHTSRAKWVTVFGTTYKKPCAVVLGTSGIHPQFGSIEDVLVNDEGVCLRSKSILPYITQNILIHLLFRRLVNYVLYISMNFACTNSTTGTEQAVILKSHVSTDYSCLTVLHVH